MSPRGNYENNEAAAGGESINISLIEPNEEEFESKSHNAVGVNDRLENFEIDDPVMDDIHVNDLNSVLTSSTKGGTGTPGPTVQKKTVKKAPNNIYTALNLKSKGKQHLDSVSSHTASTSNQTKVNPTKKGVPKANGSGALTTSVMKSRNPISKKSTSQ